MYPTLDVSTPAASLAATTTAGAGGGGGAPGASYSNSGDAGGNDGPLFPLLRVQVNSKLRVAPQVLIPPDDDSAAASLDSAVPRSGFAFDFDVERKAVERATAGEAAAAGAARKEEGDGSGEAPNPPSTSSWTPPDPWQPLFQRHKEASRAEVALAAALAQTGGGEENANNSSGSGSDVEKTLEPLRQLTQMGFDPKQALGALVISKGDLAAATDACLAAAAASGARI